ncbi:unnamed protein product [Peniophora sp. CBMAI 1063]|nr:unnamed protein product [Peniophora sp. CBMAI 1063]
MLLEIAFASNLPTINRLLPGDAPSAQQHALVSPLFVLGAVLALSGAVIRLWTYRALGPQFTLQLALIKNHELVTTGPYAYVRHPSYTAVLTTVSGVVLCEAARGSWWREAGVFDTPIGKCIALIALGFGICLVQVVSRASMEDKMLSEKFGRKWEEWKQRVPYQLFPGVL